MLQSPHLFSGTVLENIRYGKLDATDGGDRRGGEDRLRRSRSIEKLEKGYDSDVGEGGDLLSTGEKQLVSFARASRLPTRASSCWTRPRPPSTRRPSSSIQEAIAKLLEGRTSFVIAHRLSTIRQADVILVVEDGKHRRAGQPRRADEKTGPPTTTSTPANSKKKPCSRAKALHPLLRAERRAGAARGPRRLGREALPPLGNGPRGSRGWYELPAGL